MQCLILAGGFATRLWPLTEKRAKPLLPLAGRPMISHLVERIPKDLPVTISTNAVFAEDFERWRTDQAHNSKLEAHSLSILIEDAGHEGEKLGALGAVAKWVTEEHIDEDILILAGDNYIGFPIEKLTGAFDGSPLIAAYDIRDPEEAKKFGTVIAEEDGGMQSGVMHVSKFEEKPLTPHSTLVSTGCLILPKALLPILLTFAKEHPDNLGGIFEHFLSRNISVQCMAFSEPWFDIGSFDAYLAATRSLVGNRVIEEGEVTASGNAYQGSIVLGDRSRVIGSSLHDVVLFENCSIENCVIEHCVIDRSCTLRGIDLSGKMLREGTKLVQ